MTERSGTQHQTSDTTTELSADLLRGAGAIAEFLFGDETKRRQVYHLAQNKTLPIFRMGSTLCARRSKLIAWIESQEALNTAAIPE